MGWNTSRRILCRPGGRRRSDPRPEGGVNLEKGPRLANNYKRNESPQLVAFPREPHLVESPNQNQRAVSAEIPAIPAIPGIIRPCREAVEAVKETRP
jgi:hypothetical protein